MKTEVTIRVRSFRGSLVAHANRPTAYFVRNHAASPPSMPRDGKHASRKVSSEIPPVVDARTQERENFGAGLPTPAGDRDAFYTPSETPGIPAPARVGSPAVGGNGIGGPRTIAAGAFRRNKPTPAIASGPTAIATEGSPLGSPRHSQQFGTAQASQQNYTPVQLADANGQTTGQGGAAEGGFSDPGVDPSLGLGAVLAPPPPAYGAYEDAPDSAYAADQSQRGYGQGEYDDDRQLR